MNLQKCDGCNRKFPTDVKVIVKKKSKLGRGRGGHGSPSFNVERTWGGGKLSDNGEAGPTMDKKMFYSNKLQAQDFAAKMGEFSEEFSIKDTGKSMMRGSPGMRFMRGSPRGRGGRGGRKRQREIGQYDSRQARHSSVGIIPYVDVGEGNDRER